MARKLNKNLVGILTLFGMVLLAVTGFILLAKLPGQDPKVYEEEAKTLAESGEHDRAMQTFMRAYQKDPVHNPEYLVMAAESALEVGKVREARGLIAQARVKDASLKSAAVFSTNLEFEFAKLVASALQWNRLLKEAERLLEVDGQSALAHHAMGASYLNLRGEDESFGEKGEQALWEALKLDPTNTDVIQSLTEELWTSARRLEAEGHTSRAKERKESVKSILKNAIGKCAGADASDKLAELERFRAIFKIDEGAVEEGVQALESLATSEKEKADCHRMLGLFYAGFVRSEIETDYEKAEEYFRKAIEIEPDAGSAYIRLGLLYRILASQEEDPEKRQEKWSVATAVYKRGLEAIPHGDTFRSWLGNESRTQFLIELFNYDLDQAVRAADDAAREEALDSADTWLAKLRDEAGPDSVQARLRTAQLLNARGDIVGATREAEAADRISGARRIFELQQLLGELYMRQRQWGAARDALQIAVNLRPTDPKSNIFLGQVFLELDKPTQAIALLKPTRSGALRNSLLANSYAIKLRIKAYRALGQYEFAEEEKRRLGDESPSDRLDEAAELVSIGERFGEAEDIIKSVMKAHPENIRALQILVELYTRTNRMDEARSLVRNLIKDDPENREYQRLNIVLMDSSADSSSRDEAWLSFIKDEKDPLARASGYYRYHMNREDYEEAAKYLDEVERLRPDSSRIVGSQFSLSLRMQDWERAEKYAVKDAEMNIDGTEGEITQGRLAMAKGISEKEKGNNEAAKLQFARAIERMNAGLQNYPSNSLGWTYLAETYIAAGRQADAKTVLQRALQIDPTNSSANRALANMAIQEGNDEAALKYLNAAARSKPDDAWVRGQLQILKEKENPQDGILAREKIKSEDPNNLQNLVLLARLYTQTGQYDKAAEEYRQALDVSKYDLKVAREVAGFYGREDVGRPSEGEALLKKLLREVEDNPEKARVAVYLGQFFESQGALATAARHFRLAVSLDASPEALLAAGEYYSRTGQYSEALEYYERVQRQAEAGSELAKDAHGRIISHLFQIRDLDRAKKEIESYTRDYPDEPQGMIFEGAYHRLGGDIQKAKEAFQAHLERDPDNAIALWQRGELYRLMGQWRLAIDDLRKAKSIEPDAFDYQHRIALANALAESGNPDEGIAELRAILDENPDAQRVAEELFRLYIHPRVKPPRYRDAEGLVYTYMRRYPKEMKWPMLLGTLGEQSQNWEKAILGYKKAAESGPYRAEAVRSLFEAFRALGKPQAIIEHATEKLSSRLMGQMPVALSILAQAYCVTGRKELGLETYDEALAATGRDYASYTRVIAEMMNVLGKEAALARASSQAKSDPENVAKKKVLVQMLYMNNQIEEALRVCADVMKLAASDTDFLFAHLARAMLTSKIGRYEEAKTAYEAALRLDPDNSVALNNIAYLLAEQLHKPAEALPYAERANRANPNSPAVLDTLGWVLALNDRLGEATGMLLRALENDRDNVEAGYHLARVHQRLGGLDQAKQRLLSAKTAAEAQGESQFLPKIIKALEEIDAAGP